MVLVHQLFTRLCRLHDIDRGTEHEVKRLPSRNHTVAVLEETTADEFGRSDSSHCFDQILPAAKLRTRRIRRCVVQVQLPEGEYRHQRSAITDCQLNEPLALLQDYLVFIGTHI